MAAIGFALIYLAILAVLVLLERLSLIILLMIVLLSFVVFLIYWWDKSAARNNRWRIPESTLHLGAILGGWPGALIAQQTLRHKTQKQPFRWVLWLTVVANLTAVVWVFFAWLA